MSLVYFTLYSHVVLTNKFQRHTVRVYSHLPRKMVNYGEMLRFTIVIHLICIYMAAYSDQFILIYLSFVTTSIFYIKDTGISRSLLRVVIGLLLRGFT